ncbi:MAG: hypothetical protein AABY22_34505 [Nanoarchaeota archaeon]
MKQKYGIFEYFKKNKRRIDIEINASFLIFSFFGVVAGLWIFWTGVHNIDLGSNFVRVSLILEEHNITLKDHTLNDKYLTLEELYRIGVKQLFVGVFLILISSLFFASSSTILLTYAKQNGRNT